MTTFKNNAKYGEVILTYLEMLTRDECPYTAQEVLRTFPWKFKGGSMESVSHGATFDVETSGTYFPNGLTEDIAAGWPESKDAMALRRLLRRRVEANKIRGRSFLGRMGTYAMLTSSYGVDDFAGCIVYTGMRAIYHVFAVVWAWAERGLTAVQWEGMKEYIREMVLPAAGVSSASIPHTNIARMRFDSMVERSRVPALLSVVFQAKDLIRLMCGKKARFLAKGEGMALRDEWFRRTGQTDSLRIVDKGAETRALSTRVGPSRVRVSQGVAMWGAGRVRYTLGRSDAERFHQLVMASVSAIVGVCAQASVGTELQRSLAFRGVEVAERNLSRIVESSKRVGLGDEVLVCKGYRRAYTAHLGRLAGPLARAETQVLIQEAIETAAPGVLDVEGFLEDVAGLDAATSLNVCKMFKVCPAPDVSPGAAIMDRVKQIANSNTMDPEMVPLFTAELRCQILRAHIRHPRGRLQLRDMDTYPIWWADFLQGDFDRVPSEEIHEYVAWEGTGRMPDVSPHDPANWKDSGLGADTIKEALSIRTPRYKRNMMTRLVFDDECPMPGTTRLSEEHVIKFFVKAEGHKDPARGIFSANLVDRQAQSWMEKAVQSVASSHPSFMIGAPVDQKIEKVGMLTAAPKDHNWIAMYYSFDISGWSAKMPAEAQRVSHGIWADLFAHPLFTSASQINEDAFIYVNLDGYVGWYRNTVSNLEGFNGKEMTMVLVALLSLSVKRWRVKVVEAGIMTQAAARHTVALLFAYIDDGLSRIDLPREIAARAFDVYKDTVIDTFGRCGFSVEVSKCFPSDRFSIFLNEVYIAGRHVVHGVRAAMAISAEPTERHNSLIARVDSVSNGARGAVMAGLSSVAGTILMAYHTYLHILEWTTERDPVILAAWSYSPRAWGGLGLPNMMQLFTSGSGSAFEESVATLHSYARLNRSVRRCYLNLCRSDLVERDSVGVLTSPLSGKVKEGYMVDSRVAVAVRRALRRLMDDDRLSRYAERLLRYADPEAFRDYANIIVPIGELETVQEQMLINLAEAHPHSVFAAFAARLEKSSTVLALIGMRDFSVMMADNRAEAQRSVEVFRGRFH